MARGRGVPAVTRQEALRFARGIYPGRVRGRTETVASPIGGTLITQHYIHHTPPGETVPTVVASGSDWARAYMNLRANAA